LRFPGSDNNPRTDGQAPLAIAYSAWTFSILSPPVNTRRRRKP
jgi:hypothetical protein